MKTLALTAGLLLAAWLLLRRPRVVFEDDVDWTAWDPWLERAGRA